MMYNVIKIPKLCFGSGIRATGPQGLAYRQHSYEEFTRLAETGSKSLKVHQLSLN